MAIYSDVNSLNPTLQPLLTDVQDVYQSLFNLFSTIPGERLFLPDFGFALEDDLFELIDDITSVSVFQTVVEAVERWESRVTVDKSRTTVTPDPDNNAYKLALYFAINGIGSDNQTFTYVGSFTK